MVVVFTEKPGLTDESQCLQRALSSAFCRARSAQTSRLRRRRRLCDVSLAPAASAASCVIGPAKCLPGSSRTPAHRWRRYALCRAKPHPPRGCSGQCSKFAVWHPRSVTYSSLVSAVGWRSCTGLGSATGATVAGPLLFGVARTSPALAASKPPPTSALRENYRLGSRALPPPHPSPGGEDPGDSLPDHDRSREPTTGVLAIRILAAHGRPRRNVAAIRAALSQLFPQAPRGISQKSAFCAEN